MQSASVLFALVLVASCYTSICAAETWYTSHKYEYYFNAKLKMNVGAARRLCKGMDAQLLTIDGPKELENIGKLPAKRSFSFVWTDGFFDKKKGAWRWHYRSKNNKPGSLSFLETVVEVSRQRKQGFCLKLDSISLELVPMQCSSKLGVICKRRKGHAVGKKEHGKRGHKGHKMGHQKPNKNGHKSHIHHMDSQHKNKVKVLPMQGMSKMLDKMVNIKKIGADMLMGKMIHEMRTTEKPKWVGENESVPFKGDMEQHFDKRKKEDADYVSDWDDVDGDMAGMSMKHSMDKGHPSAFGIKPNVTLSTETKADQLKEKRRQERQLLMLIGMCMVSLAALITLMIVACIQCNKNRRLKNFNRRPYFHKREVNTDEFDALSANWA